LLEALDREFTYAFGGYTIFLGLAGSYLSRHGLICKDRINWVVTDTPLLLTENFEHISRYTDQLRLAAFVALEEEALLVVVYSVYHSQQTPQAP
jgi:hypothetical protein